MLTPPKPKVSNLPAGTSPPSWLAALDSPAAELGSLNALLAASLPAHVFKDLTERWVPAQIQAAIGPVHHVVQQRSHAVEHAENTSDGSPLDAARAHFQAVHPGPLAAEMTEAVRYAPVRDGYVETVARLKGTSSPVHSLALRYVHNESVVDSLLGACSRPYAGVHDPLRVHADEVKGYASALQDASKDKLGKGLAIAAGIAASFAMHALPVVGNNFWLFDKSRGQAVAINTRTRI